MKKPFKKQQNTRSSSNLTNNSQQLNVQLEKKRKFFIKQTINMIYFLTRIILTSVFLSILHQNFIQKLFNTQAYKRMQQNILLWKMDVITNITTINSYNCPEGFQTYTSYTWPGTKQGCYCYLSIDQWDYIKILQGSCSQKAMGAGCSKIDKISPIPFLFWKKNQLLCLKRIKNLDFFANLQQLNINQTACALNKDYQFDIPRNLSSNYCPVSQIQNDFDLNYKVNRMNFSFQRENQYPVVSIKMTQYQFCPNFNRQNISPFKQRDRNYNLENILRQPCDGIDPRVNIIDQIGQYQLFQNNPRIKDATKRLPSYPEASDDYRYKLGYIRYPSWKYQCRKSSQFNMIKVESYFNLQSISGYSTVCLSLTTFFIVFFGFLFTIFYVYRKVGQYYYKKQQQVLYDTLGELQRKKPNLYEKLNKKLSHQVIIFGVKILLGIVCLIILSVLIQQVQRYFYWYQDSRLCTNQIMNQWIQNAYLLYFQAQQKNIFISLIILLAVIFIDCLMFCWRTFKGDLRKQQSNQQITNIFDEEPNQKDIQERTNQSQQQDKQKQIQLGQHGINGIYRQSNTFQQNPVQILVTEDYMFQQKENKQFNSKKSNIVRRKKLPRRKRISSSAQISQNSEQWYQ